MLACALGCDTLYELGYIIIDDSGVIAKGKSAMRAVTKAIEPLLGNKCGAWTPKKAPYFNRARSIRLPTKVEG
jgi:hypothetical protein